MIPHPARPSVGDRFAHRYRLGAVSHVIYVDPLCVAVWEQGPFDDPDDPTTGRPQAYIRPHFTNAHIGPDDHVDATRVLNVLARYFGAIHQAEPAYDGVFDDPAGDQLDADDGLGPITESDAA